jgi:hypothetical protein
MGPNFSDKKILFIEVHRLFPRVAENVLFAQKHKRNFSKKLKKTQLFFGGQDVLVCARAPSLTPLRTPCLSLLANFKPAENKGTHNTPNTHLRSF